MVSVLVTSQGGRADERRQLEDPAARTEVLPTPEVTGFGSRSLAGQRFEFPFQQDTAFTLGYFGFRQGIEAASIDGIELGAFTTATDGKHPVSVHGYGLHETVEFGAPLGRDAALYGFVRGSIFSGTDVGLVLLGTNASYDVRLGNVVCLWGDSTDRVKISARFYGELSRGYEADVLSLLLAAINSPAGLTNAGISADARTFINDRATRAIGGSSHIAAAIGGGFTLQTELGFQYGSVIYGHRGTTRSSASIEYVQTQQPVYEIRSGAALGFDLASLTRNGRIPISLMAEANARILVGYASTESYSYQPSLTGGIFFGSTRGLHVGVGWTWHIATRRLVTLDSDRQSSSSSRPFHWTADAVLRYVWEAP